MVSGRSASGGDLARLFFFFFNDTATTEIYTLSLHDALPIWSARPTWPGPVSTRSCWRRARRPDRKSTRLNSSHANISYAVFGLKKKTRTHCRLLGRHANLDRRHVNRHQLAT